MTRGRWLTLVGLIVASVFALGSGFYSQRNYLALKREHREALAYQRQLRHEVDSLRAYRDSLATNPLVQERVARTQWGMIRRGELMFTVRHGDR